MNAPSGRVWRRWLASTPARLRLLVLAGWVCMVALGAVVASTAGEHKKAVHDLGEDAAPSVIAAHNIKIEVESLDADLVNEMLVPETRDAWADDFAKNRVDVGRHLIAAARSAYGAEEDAAVEKLEDTLGRYLMAAQEARDAHKRGEASTIPLYRAAFAILENDMIPAANELNRISDDQLEQTYEAQLHHSHRVRIVIVVLAVLLGALLVATQVYITLKFKRRISPGLVVGVVLTAAFAILTVHQLRAHERAMRGIKVDAYDSVDALLATLASAYEANAAESRWLLDGERRNTQEERFGDYAGRVLALPKGTTFDEAVKVLAARDKELDREAAKGIDPEVARRDAQQMQPLAATGTLATAIDNVAFPDADPAHDDGSLAVDAVRLWGTYVALDGRLRELEQQGRHDDAVAFCIGMKAGESNHAFYEFDEVVAKWLAIDQAQLAKFIDRGYASVARLPWFAGLFGLAIATALALGVRPRLQEYRS